MPHLRSLRSDWAIAVALLPNRLVTVLNVLLWDLDNPQRQEHIMRTSHSSGQLQELHISIAPFDLEVLYIVASESYAESDRPRSDPEELHSGARNPCDLRCRFNHLSPFHNLKTLLFTHYMWFTLLQIDWAPMMI